MDFLIRSRMLLGPNNLEKLASSRVALFGLGGVGGGALEALARLGIGELHLIDADEFSASNLNRQILATHETLGMKKVGAAKARVASINPECNVYTYPTFYLPDNTDIDFGRFDFVIDAIDTVSAKKDIIRKCHELSIGMVSCMGCGNRVDPSKLTCCDIFETSGDPLSKIIRKACREMGVKKLRVVYSTEEPLKPLFPIESDSPTRRGVPGSIALVPPVAGYLLAYEAMKCLTGFDRETRE